MAKRGNQRQGNAGGDQDEKRKDGWHLCLSQVVLIRKPRGKARVNSTADHGILRCHGLHRLARIRVNAFPNLAAEWKLHSLRDGAGRSGLPTDSRGFDLCADGRKRGRPC